jgi:beta-galactoside alpha-2,3-sialyltransferase (sialyltransferase 4A)
MSVWQPPIATWRGRDTQWDETWFRARFVPSVSPCLSPGNVCDTLAVEVSREQQAAIQSVLEHLAGAAQAPAVESPAVTCAVVGNSGNLLGRHYGRDIDAHTWVFRMNNAPIRGFEHDVGARTTHHVIHSNRPLVRQYDDETVTVLVVDDQDTDSASPAGREQYRKRVTTDLQWLTTRLFPDRFEPVALPFNPRDADNFFPTNLFDLLGSVRILHPAFVEYINARWFTPENRAPSDYPSTGFKALILALHLCDQVDVFGFGADAKQGRWHHYYNAGEPLTGAPAAHRAMYQEQFINELERRGVVRIHRGETS